MKTIEQELESLRDPVGCVHPEAVVEFARDPTTALHGQFEWDDKKASHAYRLWQARKVIAIVVKVVDGTSLPPTRVYVSLPSDRKREGGGYKTIVDVLSHPDWRAELLATAMAEMEAWAHRYRELFELDEVFQSIRKVKLVNKINSVQRVRKAATPVPPKSTSGKSRHRMTRKGGQASPGLKG